MCGRFARHSDPRDFRQFHDFMGLSELADLAPSYNVAPSDKALVVRIMNSEQPIASILVWGLKPNWFGASKKTPPINARSETIDSRPMFREAFAKRRCLVLCDGYYEWQRRSSGPKQPYYIYAPTMKPFALAGLWECNEHVEIKPFDTFCILTVPANKDIGHIHERMPLRLPYNYYNDWLDSTVSGSELLDELMQSEHSDWESYPVSRYVNKPMNNSKRCTEPLLVADKI